MGISAATALLVFLIGGKLWPQPASPAPVVATTTEPSGPPTTPAPPAPVAPVPPASSLPDAGAPGVGDGPAPATAAPIGDADRTAASPDAQAAATDSAAPAGDDAGVEPDARADTPASRRAERKRRRKEGAEAAALGTSANAPLPPSDGSATPPGEEPTKEATAADCALAEKDMARESWRRNWPAVCPLTAAGKAFILIPIKGPLEGENHALHRRPNREARINLAAGSESLLTMKQYKVNRLGFKDVRVNTTEDGGTRLRVKLQPGAGDPVFEVKDGYAKITVAVPDKS